MKKKIKFQLMFALIVLIYFSVGFSLARCVDETGSQTKSITGDSRSNGLQKCNVKNFISFQELKVNKELKRNQKEKGEKRNKEGKGEKKGKSFKLGDLYLIDFNIKSLLLLTIDAGYLKENKICRENKRIRIVTSYELKKRSTEKLSSSEKIIPGTNFLSDNSVIYYIEDLGLQDGDKFKIEVFLEEEDKKENNANKGWRKVSSGEIKLKIRKYGFRIHTHETIAFVRDSFGKNWEPRPGTSATLGFTFYLHRKTRGFSRFTGKIFNGIAPRVGINLTLLDTDEDENLEIGMGPVLSIFKGTFYLGIGWNLSTSRKKNRYAFFGISITEIANKIKGLISK